MRGRASPRSRREPRARIDRDGPTGEVVEIRWFCCLGAGDDPAQVEVEQAVVDAFNESHDDISVVLEVIEYEQAYDVMSNRRSTRRNPPDVVGPVGISGAEAFHGQWLDLTPRSTRPATT